MFFQQRNHSGLLGIIHLHHRFQHFEIIVILLRSLSQGLYVFRKTTTAIPNSCKQKTLSDAAIGTNAFANIVHICPCEFAKIGDFIHERNFHGQKRIGRVFGHFCRALIHKNHGIPLTNQRCVQFFHDLFSSVRFCSYHYAVGLHKILYSNAFPQKLRIGNNIKFYFRIFGNGSVYFFRCSHRYRTFINKDGVFGHDLPQIVGYFQDIFQICRTIFTRRRRQGQKDNRCSFNTFCQISRKF